MTISIWPQGKPPEVPKVIKIGPRANRLPGYFVIRQKSTGLLMPVHRGNQSFREFSAELPPRLYMRAQDALHSARYWCEGHQIQSYSKRRDEWCLPCECDIVKPVEGRTMADIEIVEIKLTRVK